MHSMRTATACRCSGCCKPRAQFCGVRAGCKARSWQCQGACCCLALIALAQHNVTTSSPRIPFPLPFPSLSHSPPPPPRLTVTSAASTTAWRCSFCCRSTSRCPSLYWGPLTSSCLPTSRICCAWQYTQEDWIGGHGSCPAATALAMPCSVQQGNDARLHALPQMFVRLRGSHLADLADPMLMMVCTKTWCDHAVPSTAS